MRRAGKILAHCRGVAKQYKIFKYYSLFYLLNIFLIILNLFFDNKLIFELFLFILLVNFFILFYYFSISKIPNLDFTNIKNTFFSIYKIKKILQVAKSGFMQQFYLILDEKKKKVLYLF